MRILQILGSGRNAGKTTVGCALIAAFPSYRWIAVKVTPHRHILDPTGMISVASALPAKDTERFRNAGAVESHLLFAPMALASFSQFVGRADAVLVESGQPFASLCWPLLRVAIAPANASLWKPGFDQRRMSADALVLTGSSAETTMPKQPSQTDAPVVFHLPDPAALTLALYAYVAAFLNGKTKGSTDFQAEESS